MIRTAKYTSDLCIFEWELAQQIPWFLILTSSQLMWKTVKFLTIFFEVEISLKNSSRGWSLGDFSSDFLQRSMKLTWKKTGGDYAES